MKKKPAPKKKAARKVDPAAGVQLRHAGSAEAAEDHRGDGMKKTTKKAIPKGYVCPIPVDGDALFLKMLNEVAQLVMDFPVLQGRVLELSQSIHRLDTELSYARIRTQEKSATFKERDTKEKTELLHKTHGDLEILAQRVNSIEAKKDRLSIDGLVERVERLEVENAELRKARLKRKQEDMLTEEEVKMLRQVIEVHKHHFRLLTGYDFE